METKKDFSVRRTNAAMTTTDTNIRFLAPCRSDVTAKAKIIKFNRHRAERP
jgi:acyl-coenzyme A thioesterase PaaI-like protein